MKKLIIETNVGTFAAYLTKSGTINIFQGDDDVAAATIEPTVKRKAVYDLSSEGIYHSVYDWLETNHARVQVKRVILHIASTGK